MEDVYERLLELWKRERLDRELQQIPEDFLEKLCSYIGSIRRQVRLSERESPNTYVRKAELEMISHLLESLLRIRFSKIVEAAFNQYSIENTLPFEKRTLNNIQRTLLQHVERIKNSLSNPKSLLAEEEEKLEIVVFLRDFPKFVGEDLRSYGPFKEGDVATIYPANAQALVQKKIVRLVKLV
ncbi:MAG: hypothetical protein RMI49_01415 [Candidatus Caldarchaeum sp.]|nr:hypothetical protein [Candidatus Caldarchaeum sp.]